MEGFVSASHVSRRQFLGYAGGLGGLTAGATIPIEIVDAAQPAALDSPRAVRAEQVRIDAARAQRTRPAAAHQVNGDEARYANRLASFGKCLPHNGIGEVDPAAFAALVRAMTTRKPADFEAIPMAGPTKLTNPQLGLSFDLQGPDSHALALKAPPAFASAEAAAEMVELYWQALTRDVPYATFDGDPLIAQAVRELSAMSDFTGPKASGAVTPGTLFRAASTGALTGPYVSQFLLLDVPFGATTVAQRIRSCVPTHDYMITEASWLACLNGAAAPNSAFDTARRYLCSARELGEFVHRNFSHQPYTNAALILLAARAPYDPGNPYVASASQAGNFGFGPMGAIDFAGRLVSHAAKAAWYHKWAVHRRLRPEELGGRVHVHKTGAARYPLHPQVLDARATQLVFERNRTYFLPQAFPEGCPTHPAYPAGHAVLAGACVTMLKAYFDESWVIPNPVVASADGLSLEPWRGAPLTVGHELDKLASNMAFGRNAAGVHYRTDGHDGLALGEALALDYLAEMRMLWNEPFDGFRVTRFDGTPVTV